jgi:xylulose-5-phosphate/fructose-6-phosphate phosphoketolase
MVMLNDLDRFHLVMDVVDRVPSLGVAVAEVRDEMQARRNEARDHTRAVGDDLPAVRNWVWPY